MLYTQSFVFNAFQENTYIIYNDEKQCWIVDPGMYEAGELHSFFTYIEENELEPQAIINTHTHLDHIFGVNAVIDKYKVRFGIHELDKPVLDGAAGSAMLFGFDFRDIPQPSFFIKENEVMMLGEDAVEIRLVPGHSPGSIVFYYPKGNWAISGDTLFEGSIGRTDLPGGKHDDLIKSIKEQLFTLPGETTIYSGHGAPTTIGHEQKHNPFF